MGHPPAHQERRRLPVPVPPRPRPTRARVDRGDRGARTARRQGTSRRRAGPAVRGRGARGGSGRPEGEGVGRDEVVDAPAPRRSLGWPGRCERGWKVYTSAHEGLQRPHRSTHGTTCARDPLSPFRPILPLTPHPCDLRPTLSSHPARLLLSSRAFRTSPAQVPGLTLKWTRTTPTYISRLPTAFRGGLYLLFSPRLAMEHHHHHHPTPNL